jgi:hypothetical protein
LLVLLCQEEENWKRLIFETRKLDKQNVPKIKMMKDQRKYLKEGK